MRVIRWVLVLLAAAALWGGCGGESDAESSAEPAESREELHFGLDGAPGPQNVGVLLASRLGYFEEVGFDAIIRSPAGPERPVSYVNGELVDLSISHAPEVVLAQAQGVPVVAVASLISQPTAAMIWLKGSGIDDVAGLRGRTIAVPGVPFQEELLRSVLAGAGLTPADVEVKRVGYELTPALVGGRADAIFGGTENVEGVELERRGLKPVVTPVQSLGVPDYEELVVIARRDRLEKDPQWMQDVLGAVVRGNAAAVEDPEAAIDVAADEGDESKEGAIEAGVEATLPLLSRDGRMDPRKMEGLVDWMYQQGLIKRKPPISALLKNDYLE